MPKWENSTIPISSTWQWTVKKTKALNWLKKAFGGTEDVTAAQGLGDVVLLAKYRLINPEKLSDIDWVVGAGPKISTASPDCYKQPELGHG